MSTGSLLLLDPAFDPHLFAPFGHHGFGDRLSLLSILAGELDS
jgi:hypothetical protein